MIKRVAKKKTGGKREDEEQEDDASYILADGLSTTTTHTRRSRLSCASVLPDTEMRSMDLVTYHRMSRTVRAVMEMSPKTKRHAFSCIRDPEVDHDSFLVGEGHFVGLVCFANMLEAQSRGKKVRQQAAEYLNTMEEEEASKELSMVDRKFS